MMSIQTLKDRLPEYAKDLRLNLGSLAAETVLNDTLKAGTFVAAAFASRNPEVIAAVNAEFAGKLAPADFTAEQVQAAVRIAAVIHAVAVTLEAEAAENSELAEAA